MINKNIRALEQEYGCIIPEKRVKTWEVQMGIWEELDRICNKHNLRYFFMWGSLLGAVRHNGFVPWDDDIDVVMPREDYNKLEEISNDEFRAPYFLITKHTVGEKSLYWHLKLVDTSTTFIFDRFISPTIHHQGITIDIVPLDGVPIERSKRIVKHIRQSVDQVLNERVFRSGKGLRPIGKVLKQFGKLYTFNVDAKARIERTERLRSKWAWDTSEYIAEGAHYHIFHRKDFEKTMYIDFEGRKAPVPVGYERVLRELYGNYMELPEQTYRMITDHEGLGWIVDPQVSYADYENIMKHRKSERSGELQKTFRWYCKKLI